jgi:alkylation response protein AidB-like acyl-CoA dehydrogenase
MATLVAPTTLDGLLGRVRALEPLIREYAPQAERARRLAQPVSDALRDAGVFRMFRPASRGDGLELDPVTAFRVFEELSRIDSSVGWNVANANAAEVLVAWYSDHVTEEVCGSPETVMAGAWNPPRKAVPAAGGYRISGRTVFSSNCRSATWILGLANVFDGDDMRVDESGAPVTLMTLFPMREVEIVDNWNALGMRGTGSDDVVANDLFVPEERAVPLGPLENPGIAYAGPFHRLSIWPAVGGLVPTVLGVARAAIDDFIEMATKKMPMYTATALRERSVVQLQVAEAEAKLGAARCFLFSVFDEVWQRAQQGQSLDMSARARCQLASSHAVVAAAEAVDRVYLAAGGSAIRDEQPFQRYFRDVHVITQHAFVSPSRFEAVGQIMLGLEPDWPFFQL